MVSLCLLVYHGGRLLIRLVRGTLRFLDDWLGEDPRPGFEGRPGFPERIANLEHRFRVFEVDLAEVKKELHPNSGSSLRDAVNRVEQSVKEQA